MFRQRLSEHFLLLDFLYDRANYFNPKPLTGRFISDETLGYGVALCNELLEPLTHHVGPCSVAAGIVLEGTDQHAMGPHGWNHARGAAADVVFHRWVNSGLDPAGLVGEAVNHGLRWARWIVYAGTEFSCLAYHPRNFAMSTYVNRRPARPGEKPFFQQVPNPENGIRPNLNWRRQPGEVVFHTRRTLRAQHVRVGRYFTLLDFCRSETALMHGIASVPPPTSINHIISAHQAAALLDPIVDRVGRLSILLGIESQSARAISGRGDTEWRQAPDKEMVVRFAFPASVDMGSAQEAMFHIGRQPDTATDLRQEGSLLVGEVHWLPFDTPWFSSARLPEGADQHTIYRAIEADIVASRNGVMS